MILRSSRHGSSKVSDFTEDIGICSCESKCAYTVHEHDCHSNIGVQIMFAEAYVQITSLIKKDNNLGNRV